MEYKTFNLKGTRELTDSHHSESRIFIKGSELFKILNGDKITSKRKETIELLSEFSNPFCVFPNYGLLNKKGDFCGYEMDYQHNYTVMLEYLRHNYIPFKIRKECIKMLCRAIDYLERNGISFIDLHSENILVNDKGIKIIDLDGSIPYEHISSYSKNARKAITNMRLALMSLSLLFNNPNIEYNFPNDSEVNKLLKSLNKNKAEIIKKVFTFDNGTDTIIDIEEDIDSFDEEKVEYARHILRLR